MKPLIACAALLGLAAPAHAQWEPPDEVLQVRAKGGGAWLVRCEWQSAKGEPAAREMRGPGGWERLHVNKPVNGACSWQAAPDQPLTIRLRSPLYRCTLPAPEPKACEQTFPAGASGRIDIRPRS